MASCKGKRSGLAAPTVATLVVDPESPTTTALVVEPSTCAETAITRRPTEEPNEFRIVAGNMSLGAVTSLPTVQSLMVPNNNIKSLDVGSTVLFEIDLTNNLLTNLDSIKLPGSLKRLYLDFNPLKKITAGQLPSSLIELYMEKANIDSLAGFKFPNQLKILSIKGNRQLASLYGLVLPTGITTFDCSDSAVTEVAGVTFPKTLQKMTVTGTKPLSTFDFRASDLALLSKMQLQATTVPGMTCPDSRGTITVITSTVSGCAYSDVDFAAKYPPIVVTEPPSSGRTPTPADGSSNGSPLAASPAPVPTGGGGGGNSTQTIIVGVLVLVAVIVGVGIGFVFQRRRRAKRSSQDAEDDDTRATSKRSKTKTKTKTDDRTGSYDHGVAPPNSNGFLENDVRNDEALIIHRVPQEEIVLVSKLAKGGFGIVYKAKLHSQDVVVKQITPDKADSTDAVKRFMDEIRLYSKLQHGKIVHFVGLSWTNLFDLSLIMEYMPNGDLHMLLRSVAAEKDIEFEWFKAHSGLRCKALMATDVAEALVYLHSYSPPIIHRDLKARNIMLAEDYTAKLGDFGISRVSAEDTMTGGMGTTAWIAPEVLQGERYSEKADIYSFGILLCEMDVCDHPYRSSHATGDETLTDAKIAFLVSTASLRPQLREDCPGAIQKLIYECIDFDPAKRPSAVELHYNIRKVREAALEWGFV